MATFKKFEEMECWSKARELARRVYEVSGKGMFARDFGLKDQIRRASVSIMSNIAEGHDRSGTGEFVQFLSNAKGSAAEVRCQLYVRRTDRSGDRDGAHDSRTNELPAFVGLQGHQIPNAVLVLATWNSKLET